MSFDKLIPFKSLVLKRNWRRVVREASHLEMLGDLWDLRSLGTLLGAHDAVFVDTEQLPLIGLLFGLLDWFLWGL